MNPNTDFRALFDTWAATYDQTVQDRGGEYAEVFDGYETILARVADAIRREPGSVVVDVGTGTGNLARAALKRGYRVVAVEPSTEMRRRAGRVDGLELREGDFLGLPVEDGAAAAVISSWAFHHVLDAEKPRAVRELSRVLDAAGRIVFADTTFVDDAARRAIHARAEGAGFLNLLKDLQSEFYTTHEVLRDAFASAGFRVGFEQLNRYVWLIEAERER